MAEIHIKEIINHLEIEEENGFFLELKFHDLQGKKSGIVDEDFKNKVITVDSPYGSVTILFDDEGQLKSIEIC